MANLAGGWSRAKKGALDKTEGESSFKAGIGGLTGPTWRTIGAIWRQLYVGPGISAAICLKRSRPTTGVGLDPAKIDRRKA
jgi:hypothetical protein